MSSKQETPQTSSELSNDVLQSCSIEFQNKFKVMTPDLQRRIRKHAEGGAINLEVAYKEICEEDAEDGYSPLYWQR